MTWRTPVTSLLPTFKLGDAETTRQILVEHLICACTGMPRQDYEMIFQFGGITVQDSLTTLGTMQPTSKFGELFQYSKPNGRRRWICRRSYTLSGNGNSEPRTIAPMQSQVFDPLEMKSGYVRLCSRVGHKSCQRFTLQISMAIPPKRRWKLNYCVIPHRPAGGAWMNVRDLAAYVAMELAKGKLR